MSTNDQPQIYYVLFHSPGSAWVEGTGFREQPGVIEHARYMMGFQETGHMQLGGPFLDDTGGMMVMRAASQEEAEGFANADPCVKNGLLTVQVKPWMTVFESTK